MTDQAEPNQTPDHETGKKQSLADAAKEMLRKKKEAQAQKKQQPKYTNGGQPVMKSQHSQKPNNTRKKMGV